MGDPARPGGATEARPCLLPGTQRRASDLIVWLAADVLFPGNRLFFRGFGDWRAGRPGLDAGAPSELAATPVRRVRQESAAVDQALGREWLDPVYVAAHNGR